MNEKQKEKLNELMEVQKKIVLVKNDTHGKLKGKVNKNVINGFYKQMENAHKKFKF